MSKHPFLQRFDQVAVLYAQDQFFCHQPELILSNSVLHEDHNSLVGTLLLLRHCIAQLLFHYQVSEFRKDCYTS